MAEVKYFLDTSVLRPILVGTDAYKKYFQTQLGKERKYVSKYVLMEFKRSYIIKILNFYFVLDMPNINTIGDAMTFWSNKFKISELKAIIQFISQIITSYELINDNPKDKQMALIEIGRYVKRLEMKLRRSFLDIGKNEAHCHRALIQFTKNDYLTGMFRDFLLEFNDVQTCRSKCIIDKFFLIKYKNATEKFIADADKLENPNSAENKGFKNIADSLKKASKDKVFSCKMCEIIGDSVIALESPKYMRLEHTDHSFDHLCDAINQHHFKHPSETAIVKYT